VGILKDATCELNQARVRVQREVNVRVYFRDIEPLVCYTGGGLWIIAPDDAAGAFQHREFAINSPRPAITSPEIDAVIEKSTIVG
jgi:hypothetical protein